MVKFRQVIRPGESGRDVKAVKIAYRRLGVKGSGAMNMSKKAGPAFVDTTEKFQFHHGLKPDGIYGEMTHKRLTEAKRWTAYMNLLYRTARLRHPVEPPVTKLSAQAAARELLNFHARGEFRDDRGTIMAQIKATAEGKPVWSPAGRFVYIDRRVLELLVFLVEKGLHIGCFALCSDHFYDGPQGHSAGNCVDISSVNGITVASGSPIARSNTLKAAQALAHEMPATLKPAQLICDGYGYVHDSSIAACTIPSAGYYGYTTMSQHRNHLHVGYFN